MGQGPNEYLSSGFPDQPFPRFYSSFPHRNATSARRRRLRFTSPVATREGTQRELVWDASVSTLPGQQPRCSDSRFGMRRPPWLEDCRRAARFDRVGKMPDDLADELEVASSRPVDIVFGPVASFCGGVRPFPFKTPCSNRIPSGPAQRWAFFAAVARTFKALAVLRSRNAY